MSLDDDDLPTAAPPAGGNDPAAAAENGVMTAEDALEEEQQDFSAFAAMFRKNTGISAQTIRKGEKDFESHGTKQQENTLEKSRRAMTEVLSYTRVHTPQNWSRGWYFPDWWAEWPEEEEEEDQREGEGKEGERKEKEKKPYAHVRNRVVILENSSLASQSMGRAITGQPKDRPGRGRDWLLPEEALYLVERGSLDLWWPTKGMEDIFSADPEVEQRKKKEEKKRRAALAAAAAAAAAGQDEGQGNGEENEDDDFDEDEYENGFPLSLQAAYSLLIGKDGERGKISLQKFQVYSNLKRAGYNVLRAPPLHKQQPAAPVTLAPSPPSLRFWEWLFAPIFNRPEPTYDNNRKPYGPLVQPGLYRSWNPIYNQMALIPRHKPSPNHTSPFPMTEPFAIYFHVWKSSSSGTTKWTKLRHPPPDFHMAVVDAQETDVPDFATISGLVDMCPYDRGKPEWASHPGRLYARLKHGARSALVAVVDHGIINYMRFAEGTFGEEELYRRFDATRGDKMRGGKKFGGNNNGRGGTTGGRGGGNGGRGGRGGGRGGRGRGR